MGRAELHKKLGAAEILKSKKKVPAKQVYSFYRNFFLKSSPLTEIDSTQNELKEQLQRCEGKVSKMSLEAFFGEGTLKSESNHSERDFKG